VLTNEWTFFDPVNIARCAFSASAVNNSLIFIFGGYDGTQRLESIEKYDPEVNKWEILSAALRFPLSNCACFSYSNDNIVILGGGFSSGFSLAVEMLNIVTEQWTSLPMMTEGRDLRNKVTVINGYAYCIGGYNFKSEALNLATEEWI
jgi:hypothetical protein